MIGPLIPIGKIVKPHGIEGGMKIVLKEPFELLDLNECFLFIHFEGLPVPFWVTTFLSNGFQQVFIERIDTKEAAIPFAGKEVFVEQKIISSNTSQPSNPYTWEGYHLLDLTSNRKGEIIKIEEYPQQLMATIHTEDKDVLIPLHEDFLIAVDDLSQLITVKLPEGLFG